MRKTSDNGWVRTYVVCVSAYCEARYTAPSAGKARAQAYRDFCDAITRKTFHEFLIVSRVRRVNPSESERGSAVMAWLMLTLQAIAMMALMLCAIGNALAGEWGNAAAALFAMIALML
jgi:hypothetical protein